MDDPVVIVNVGGTKFHAKLSTLTNKSKYFGALYSREPKYIAEELYIDRDPILFAVLLKSWRGYRVDTTSDSENIDLDCDYYICEKIIEPKMTREVLLPLMRSKAVGNDKIGYTLTSVTGILHPIPDVDGEFRLTLASPTRSMITKEMTGFIKIPKDAMLLVDDNESVLREYTICYSYEVNYGNRGVATIVWVL